MYFIITVGAFLPSTVRGLLHTYTCAFITNYYSRIRYNSIQFTQTLLAHEKILYTAHLQYIRYLKYLST